MLDQFRIAQSRPVPGSCSRRLAAVQIRSGRRVLLHFWNEQDGASWDEASLSVESARQVQHPHLDRVYQSVTGADGNLAISQWPEGSTLEERLQQGGPFAPDRACAILRQLASGLGEMHAHQIVHGHLFPSEVVVQTDGQIKLLRQPLWVPHAVDMGQLAARNARVAARYLAPEFLRPGTCPDRLTDLYALGCLFYLLIAGRPPFDGLTVDDIMTAHATQRVDAFHPQLEVPDRLTDLIARMMAKRRELRIASVPDLIGALNQPFAPPQDSEREARPLVTIAPHRRRDRQQWKTAWVVAAVMAISAALLLATWARSLSPDSPLPGTSATDKSPRLSIDSPVPAQIAPSEPSSDSSNAARVAELVDDDGRTLWASPTWGKPIAVNYFPPGAQMFVYVRPSALLESEGRTRVLQALGPMVDPLRAQFEQRMQTDLGNVTSLLFALTPQDNGAPLVTWVAELTPDARDAAWHRSTNRRGMPAGAVADLEGHPVLFPADAPSMLVDGDETKLLEIAAETFPPRLRRQMEVLLRTTDDQRQLTVLVAPSFLAADGRSLLEGLLAPLRATILALLKDDTQAACLSLHVDQNSYAELCWLGPSEINPRQSAAERLEVISRYPEQLGAFLGGRQLDPYWQPLAARLPLMVQFAVQHVRSGANHEIAVLNLVLPYEAAHNLFLAGELALASQLRPVPSMSTSGTSDSVSSGSIDSLLAQPVTLSFDVQSFETSLEEFAEVVRQQSGRADFSVRIVGPDLQLEGITRNQQVRDLQLLHVPGRRVLTELVQRANPIRTTDARDLRQKLVWVIDPDAPAGILITTRAAASQKEIELPKEFLANRAP